jgi:hypothetical protein
MLKKMRMVDRAEACVTKSCGFQQIFQQEDFLLLCNQLIWFAVALPVSGKEN